MHKGYLLAANAYITFVNTESQRYTLVPNDSLLVIDEPCKQFIVICKFGLGSVDRSDNYRRIYVKERDDNI
jgi:hypothetical protein